MATMADAALQNAPQLLDHSRPLDVALLDSVMDCMQRGTREQVRADAAAALRARASR